MSGQIDRPNSPLDPARRPGFPEVARYALGTPLQPTVVYRSAGPDALDDIYEGRADGFTYAREGHPNAASLAARIDAMEGGQGGVVLGSGMAAITAVLLGVCRAGDHVVGGNQLYGKSLKMLREDLPRLGISTTLADAGDAASIAAAIRPETRIVMVEVVSNPTLRAADIAAIAEATHAAGALLVIDNTFTTPRGFQAFEHGADIVVHSVTKLLAGHSDVTLGYACARDSALNEAIGWANATFGLTASPYDCWMAERGLATFALRYDRAEENAAALAEHLAAQPGVRRVLYPGRADHPDGARMRALLGTRFGNMVSFEVDGGRAAANAMVAAMPDLPFAPTLGDVGTTLSHPATSSHRGLTPEGRAELGMSEGFFRISVGIEDIDLLRREFTAGCAAAHAAAQAAA